MKRKEHQDPLDNRLRNMPKPNLPKSKEMQIKQSIMSTRASRQKIKKRINLKGITATFGALAAAVLFAVLIYGNMNPTTDTASLSLSSFVDEDVVNIRGFIMDYTYLADDIEVIKEAYESDDEDVIQLFNDTVGTLQFSVLEEEVEDDVLFTEFLNIFNKDGELLGILEFSQSEIVSINGEQYKIEPTKWRAFRDVFFTDKYLVVEEDDDEDEDKTDEQPEETEDFQKLLDSELAISPKNRNWEKIIGYIKEGANPNKALLVASKENNVSIVSELLSLGANPNAINQSKDTPLTLTTSPEVASLLLKKGAEVEHRNERNYNALVKAVYGHQPEMVQTLLEHGADPNTTVTPSSDKTVLWMAGKYNFMPIGEILIQHGAELVEGYEFESWMASEVPFLEDMLDENFLSYAAIGRLPNILTIQLPADANVFENQYSERFESFEVEGGIADVYGDHIFIKLDGQDMYTSYRYELNPGDNVTVADVENTLGTPSSTYMDGTGDRGTMSYMLNYYELRLIYDGTVTYPKDETDIIALELHYKQPGVIQQAEKVFQLLADRNMKELAGYVHPEKGLLFAPFLQLSFTVMTDQHEPILFSADEIPGLLEDQTVYKWGDHGASGLPIEMTPIEFLDEYIYTAKEPDAFYVNQQNLMGPEFFTNHVRELYPEAHMVQYSFDETVEGYDLSWMQLTLIFEEYEGEWKLVGVLHNEWTP